MAVSNPVPVEAHALLERADPPVNATLREPPAVLTLYFTEGLERRFSSARVVDQLGGRVDERVEFDGANDALMRVFLRPVNPGYLTVFWENVSSVDGHRISGSYPLTILNPDGGVPEGSPSAVGVQVAGEEAKPPFVAAKFFLLLAGCLLTGAFAFLAWVAPGLSSTGNGIALDAVRRNGRMVIVVSLIVLTVAAVAELLLQASNINQSVGAVLDTRWGERWLLRNAVLLAPAGALLLLTTRSDLLRRAAAWLGLAGAVAYLIVVSSVSHGAASSGAFWAATSDFIHLFAGSVWIGMLLMLALTFFWALRKLAPGDRYPVLSVALSRFSTLAVLSLALLLLTGTVNAVIQVGRLDDLIDTSYGRALLIKLLLVAPLLAIGGLNAYLLRPLYVQQGEGASQRTRGLLADQERRLLSTIRLEFFAAVAVLLVVAVLVQLTPTRGRITGSTQSAGEFVETKSSAGIAVTFLIDPNQPGVNSFEVYLAGAVNTVESVRLNFERPGAPGELSRLDLDASNPPTFYVGRGPFLAQPGKWKVSVDMRRSAGSDLAIPFNVQVPDIGGQVTAGKRGGSFAAPVSLSTASTVLLATVGVVTLGIVLGSVPRPGLPAGYLGWAARALVDRASTVRLRPVWSLGALVILGIALGLLLGQHVHGLGGGLSKDEASRDNPVAASPASIERGKMLFMQSCVQCHGETGRGDGPLAASLPLRPANLYDHVPYHPDQFFFSVITNGVGGVMPAFSQIDERDRWNILNFLRDEFGQPPAAQ